MPYPWDILLGRHGCGMSPELETEWSRAFLLAGFVAGIFAGSWLAS